MSQQKGQPQGQGRPPQAGAPQAGAQQTVTPQAGSPAPRQIGDLASI
jgi:hypothetical protein